MEQLEHPAITRCLETGYPYPITEDETEFADEPDEDG